MANLELLKDARFGEIGVKVYENRSDASVSVARRIANLIKERQSESKMAVLGLATGATPVKVYEELIRLHREEGLSFRNVISFNLDEYFPMQPDSKHSYVEFMKNNLFAHIDILPENVHIPDGTLKEEDVEDYCEQYENKIEEVGGIDLQLLGIGRTGHIGFNEPGSSADSLTRMVVLNDVTRTDAAGGFGGKENVPTKAITMGVGSVFKAKAIVLMAWGESKAEIVKHALEGEVSSDVPATFLQHAKGVEFVLDKDAATLLATF